MQRRILLFCVLIFAFNLNAANYYWRVTAVNNNFNNVSNWTDNPTGVAGNSPGSPPTLLDNVYFSNVSNIMTIAPTQAVNMQNLTVTYPGYRFSGNVNYNIAGNISLDSTFQITSGTVNMVDNTSSPDVNIDLGTNSIIQLGAVFNINKPASKVELINHDFRIKNRIDAIICKEFKSNGKNMQAERFNTAASTTSRLIDLSGSTLTAAATSGTYAASLFYKDANTTYVTENCDLICFNPTFTFYGISASESNFKFKSISLKNPNSGTLISYYRVNLEVQDLIFSSPLITFSNNTSYGGEFKNLTISNKLEITDQSFISFKTNDITDVTNIEVKSMVIPTANSCASQNTILATYPVTLKSTGAPITTQNLTYGRINFAGNGWSAPESDNLGGNSGNINWTDVSGQDYYWIGGSGDWEDPLHWSLTSGGQANPGGCTPGATDNVYIDNNSFTANGQYIHLKASKGCRNIYWTDINRRGTLNSAGEYISLTINASADFSGIAEAGIYPDLYFAGSDNHTITSAAGITYSSKNIYFIGSGAYTLQNDFLSAIVNNNYYGSYVFHYLGGLISNGKTINVGRFESIPYFPEGMRSFDFSNSDIQLKYNTYNNSFYALNLDHTNLSSYDFSNSLLYIDSYWSAYNITTIRAVNGKWEFNDITFADPFAAASFSFSVQTNSINKLTCNGNTTFGYSMKVDSVILSPNKTYSFAANQTFTVESGMTILSNGCDMATIKSNNASVMAKIQAVYSPFELSGAKVTGINATGSPLTVHGGIDQGNNTNVTIIPNTPQNFYWVGGEGNWSDPANWSIGISGGNPSITNSGNCIPSDLDSVFFDAGSFSSTGQKVTLDITPVNINSMIWTEGVNPYKPVFRASTNATVVYINGSLEWAADMDLQFNYGNGFSFVGTKTAPYSQTFTTNNVVPSVNSAGAYSFSGGRFDILGNVSKVYNISLSGATTQFYTNGYDINANYLYLNQGAQGIIDLADSDVFSGMPMSIVITNNEKFYSENATIRTTYSLSITNTNMPVRFKNISSDFGGLTGKDTIYTEKLTMTNPATATINGKFIADTVMFAKAGSIQQLTAGTTLTVNDTIIGSGTPCSFIEIRSTDITSGGQTATLKTGKCDITATFFNLTNITGQNDDCPSQALNVIGRNLGGNSNITFTEPPTGTIYFTDTIIACQNLPYIFNPRIPGFPVSYEWYRNGIKDATQTGESYPVNSQGSYLVKVTYEGTNCVTNYDQKVTAIVDSVAPKIAPLADTLVIIQNSNTHVFTGNTRDPQITENCFLKNVWYSLSGATVADSISASTLDGVVFNKGLTTVTWYAMDSIPATWSVNAPNVGSRSFTVTVEKIIAVDDYTATLINTPVNIPALENDTFPTLCKPVITLPDSPSNASVSDSLIIYNPPTGFMGSDTITYQITCSGITSEAQIFILVQGYPDNISNAECFVVPETQDWDIKKLDSVGLVYTCGQFLVGDMNDDGFPDIVGVLNYPIDGIGIFYGPDFTVMDSIKGVSPEPNTFGAIGKIKTAEGVYENLIFFRNTTSNTNPSTYTLRAVRTDGTSPWASNPVCDKGMIGLADFNHDGWSEVYVGNKIYDAATGKLLASGSGNSGRAALMSNHSNYIAHSQAVNILGDANLELIAGNQIYKVDIDRTSSTAKTLEIISSVTPPTNCPFDGVTVVADFNNDGKLEVLVRQRGGTSINMSNTTIHLYLWSPHTDTSTGQLLASTTEVNTFFGIPFVGDIDGDGKVEIVTLSSNSRVESQKGFIARKYDEENKKFTTFWNINHIDQSGGTGMTLFDFNLDGIAEIVYRDEYELRIINGSGIHHDSGDPAAPYTLSSFKSYSATAFEYPVVVDIYNNGSSAILVTSDTGETRTNAAQNNYTNVAYIDIFTSDPATPWAPARKVWNQYSYNAVVVNEDLTIPAYQFDMATVFAGADSIIGTTDDVRPFNNFLQQQTMLNIYGNPLLLSPNATITSPDPVSSYKADSLTITVAIMNNGNAALRSPVYITVYKDSVSVNSTKYTYTYTNSIQFNTTDTVTFAIPDFTLWVGQIYEDTKLVLKINDKGNAESDQPVCDEKNIMFTIDLSSVNLASDDYVITTVNTPVVIDMLDNDALRSCMAGDSIPVVSIGMDAKHGETEMLTQPEMIKYTPDSAWVGIDSIRYVVTTCGTMKDSAMIYIATLKPVSQQYFACPGASLSIGMQAVTGVTYYWYSVPEDSAYFATGNSLTVVKNDSLVQTFYVEAHFGNHIFPRYRIDLLMGSCGNSIPEGCAADGTIIWKEDFDAYDNGLDPSSPVYSRDPLPAGMTTYTFTNKAGTIRPNTGIYAEASYGLIKDGYDPNNPTSYTSHFPDDHTWPDDNTTGRFLITNGRTTPDRVYIQTIDSLCNGLNEMFFSFWMAGHDGEIQWSIYAEPSNELLTVYKLPKLPNRNNYEWKHYGFPFTLPDDVNSIRFEIFNNAVNLDGNDVVFDDIEVRLCTPPVEIITPMGNDTLLCTGSAITMKGKYEDDGTFGDDLQYRWMYSATGDISDPDSWSLLPGTDASGSVSDGTVDASYSIDSATLQNAGFYRLLVASPAAIDDMNCRAMSKVIWLRVAQLPEAVITGKDSICLGDTTTLSPVAGGSWYSSNPQIALVSSNGVVTPLADGKVVFTFIDSLSGCTAATDTLTIGTYPVSVVPIEGPGVVCVGNTINLTSATTGGIWTSSDTGVAVVNNALTNPAIIIGLTEGNAAITYTVGTNGCTKSVEHNVQVLPLEPPKVMIGIKQE